MRLRSLLFVPGDSEKKFAKAREIGADALILDLEDSVALSMKDTARGMVQGWLDQADQVEPALFVRINPLDGGLTVTDLAAVVRPGRQACWCPKPMASMISIASPTISTRLRSGRAWKTER